MADDDIQGQITGPDGNPVEGAKVYLFREDATSTSANSVATATTDANGEYIFTSHPNDTSNLEKWVVTAKYESGGTRYQYRSLWGVQAAIGNASGEFSGEPDFPHEVVTVEPYQNPEPLPSANNPVLTARDVTDANADFVADPFIYIPDLEDSFSDWHMFFEVYEGRGKIGHATSTDNGITWNYNQLVLSPSFHLSYSQVFRYEGSYYMIPNPGHNDYLPLYKADTWPTNWTQLKQWLPNVANNISFKDHSTYFDAEESRWYLITGTDDGGTNSGVRAYYSDKNIGLENITWNAHPGNPVVSGRESAARAAGRGYTLDNGEQVAFYQDTVSEYGDKVRAYEITTLTTSSFADAEYTVSPILEEGGTGWRSDKMHHYDPWWRDGEGRWVAAVDGHDGSEWSIGMYHVPTIRNNNVEVV